MPADHPSDDLHALLGIARDLGATTELLPLLQRVEHAMRHVLDCDRGTVFLYDGESDELYSLVATGEETIRFASRLGIAGEAFHTRSMVNVPDAYADERFNRAIDQETGFRTRNLIAFPMIGHDGLVVGVLQALNKHGRPFDTDDERVAETLSRLAGVAIQRQMLLDEFALKQQMERNLAIAREIQQRLLPKRDPVVEGYEVAGWNNPADETGGDCYDYVHLSDDKLAVMMADVTGHGIGPALIVSECRALIRALASTSCDPADILVRTNRLIHEDLDQGRFVTTFLGVLDPEVHELRYLSAGQGPVLHYQHASGTCRELPATTFPLGILGEIEPEQADPIALAPGDMVALVTDGFFEWDNGCGQQFGTDRIARLLHEHRALPPQELISRLHAAVRAFGAGASQADDLTAVLIKRK